MKAANRKPAPELPNPREVIAITNTEGTDALWMKAHRDGCTILAWALGGEEWPPESLEYDLQRYFKAESGSLIGPRDFVLRSLSPQAADVLLRVSRDGERQTANTYVLEILGHTVTQLEQCLVSDPAVAIPPNQG